MSPDFVKNFKAKNENVMKAIYRLVLISILTFALNQQSYAQGETHTITLNVNTAQVAAQNLSATSNFGQAAGIANEDFTLEVNVGDIIVWNGSPTAAVQTDAVKITSIDLDIESGINFFGSEKLTPNNQSQGVVLGIITSGNPGEVQKYSITFEVMNEGVSRGSFTIDPKIQVKN
jgi:hypothetical protein